MSCKWNFNGYVKASANVFHQKKSKQFWVLIETITAFIGTHIKFYSFFFLKNQYSLQAYSYKKLFFLFLYQNIWCGYSKEWFFSAHKTYVKADG